MERNIIRANGIAADSSIFIPPPPDGKTADAMAAVEKAVERQQASMREQHQMMTRLEAAARDYEAAIIKEFGESTWKEFRQHVALQKQTNFGLGERFAPKCSEDFERLAKAKQTAREKTQAIIKRAGVKPETLERISKEYLPKLDQLTPARSKVGSIRFVTKDKVPREIREHTTNPWTYVYPPYTATSWSYSWSVYGNVFYYRTENEAAGYFGQIFNHKRTGAGDFEASTLYSDQSMGFWYYTPQAGTMELWAIIKADAVQIRFDLDWECCFSRAKHDWEGHFKVTVGSTEVMERIWREYYEIYCSIFTTYDCDYNWTGYPVCDQIAQEIKLGTAWYVHVDVPNVSAGWNWVSVGTHLCLYTFMNDYSCDANLIYYYFIPEVVLRVV